MNEVSGNDVKRLLHVKKKNGAEVLKIVERTSKSGQMHRRNYTCMLLCNKVEMGPPLISVTPGTLLIRRSS